MKDDSEDGSGGERAPTDADESDPIHDVASVTHGAVVTFNALSAQKVLRFALNFVLTQYLSVRLYGVYAFGSRAIAILTRFTPLGSGTAILRLLPKYMDDADRRDRILGLAYITTIVTSVTLGAAMFLLAPALNRQTLQEPLLVDALRLFAVLLPFNTLVGFIAQYFRTLEMAEYHAAILYVGKPGARLIGAVVAIGLGYSLLGVVGAFVAFTAILVGGILLAAFVRTDLRPSSGATRSEAREFYNYSLPNALASVGGILRSRIDVVLVGALLTASDAGVYNIVLLFVGVLAIPLQAFNQILPPVASRLYTQGDYAALKNVYRTITRYVYALTVLGATILLVYRTELLSVFGAEYVRGTTVLAVFIGGRVIANACGATGWLLLMTDHQYLHMLNNWVLAVLNVALSYLFIVHFGLVGAALGTGSAIAMSNLLRLAELWYLEGLQPFDRTFLKPTVAGVVAAAAMVGLEGAFTGILLLTAGAVTGVLVFFAVLVGLGVESEDRRLVATLVDSYGLSLPSVRP